MIALFISLKYVVLQPSVEKEVAKPMVDLGTVKLEVGRVIVDLDIAVGIQQWLIKLCSVLS